MTLGGMEFVEPQRQWAPNDPVDCEVAHGPMLTTVARARNVTDGLVRSPGT